MHLIKWCLYYVKETAFVVDIISASSAFCEVLSKTRYPKTSLYEVVRELRSHDDVGSNGFLVERSERSGEVS